MTRKVLLDTRRVTRRSQTSAFTKFFESVTGKLRSERGAGRLVFLGDGVSARPPARVCLPVRLSCTRLPHGRRAPSAMRRAARAVGTSPSAFACTGRAACRLRPVRAPSVRNALRARRSLGARHWLGARRSLREAAAPSLHASDPPPGSGIPSASVWSAESAFHFVGERRLFAFALTRAACTLVDLF